MIIQVIYLHLRNITSIRYPLWGKTSIDYDDTHKYDSDTELNEIMPSTSIENTQRWKVTQQFFKFNTVIVAWFLKSLEFLKLRTSRKREYYTHHERIRYNGIVISQLNYITY